MRKRVAISASLVFTLLALPALAVSPNIVISQVYGGGNNSGATYRNDFVEVFNRSAAAVSLTGMSIQYASASGTGTFGSNGVATLSGTLNPGQYYLVQLAGGTTNGSALPTADVSFTAPNLSGTSGKVVLVDSTSGLACNGGSDPCDAAETALIRDLVGYGTADYYETAAAPTLTNTTAALRAGSGCTETDNNSTDFTAVTPSPRNTATTLAPCSGSPSIQLSIDDVSLAEGDSGPTNFAFTVTLSAPAPAGGVTFDIATSDGSATTADNDYFDRTATGQSIPAGETTCTFDVTGNGDATFEPDETFLVDVTNLTPTSVTIRDNQGVGTIVDDDGVAVSVNDVSQVEGAAGASNFTFTVSLSRPAKAGGVWFDIATGDGTATVADGDYDERWLTDQFIAEGATSATFDVTVNGDTAFEGDETFLVQVTGVAGTDAYLADSEGVGTIVNDDAALLVINEIDYDQPSPPTADSAEFVELYNRSAASIDLGTYSLRLINGDSGGATTYDSISLPDVTLAPGDYFVVCANAATVPNCDLDDEPDTNFLQNGGPDAVALFEGGVLVDTVSYEGNTGAPYTEGSGAGLIDDSSVVNAGISRYPDGTDTGANATDLSLRCITPGLPNVAAASDCPTPYLYGVRINELDADTPGTDAAEFVELFDGGKGGVPLDGLVVVLYNGSTDVSYAAYDLDGYTTDASGYFLLGNSAVVPPPTVTIANNFVQNGQDAAALYRANAADFPTNTPVTTGNLQDAIVYDTNDADDPGLLVLLNAGQPQVNESATGASEAVSNQRCPSGYGGLRNTVSYVQMAPTPGAAGVCAFEIFTIQGSGMASPFAGFPVTTNDNVVTAVGPEGFFIQTPDARADADAGGTSNGVYVYTGSAPSVAVGDQVDVTGTVQEFFDFTELAGTPSITVDADVPVMPLAVAFDAATPSPLQPQSANALERYEGMLVTVAAGVVSGPSQSFGSDPTAEAFVVAGPVRPFREPGVEYPGLGGGLPVWDGNPEVFELDPDKLSDPTSADPIPAGSTFSATGVLGYEFGGYELWATSLSVTPTALPVPVRARASGELTVGSLNTYRLFDDVDNQGSQDNSEVRTPADYARHLQKLSLYIRSVLGAPDILGVQEVEHLDALQDLADRIVADDPTVAYTAYLVEGNDVGGIDNGLLVRSETVANEAITQLGKDVRLSVDNSLLHDRPPLLLEADYVGNGAAFPIKVLVVHQRSLTDIETSARVRQKRLEQAQSVAQMVQDLQDANPAVRLVVVGDFNAFEVTDGYVDVTGQIKGDFLPADNLLSGPDLVSPDLVDEVLDLPAESRYSFVFNGTAQVLDHALTSQGIAPFVRGMEYGRGNADAPEVFFYDNSTAQRCSDHDGLVLYVITDSDGDGYPDDAPQFALFNNANGQATGNVSDPSGIASLVLGPGSANVLLTPSGAVGDGVWGWSVTLANAELAGQAELVAMDRDGREARYIVALGSFAAVPTVAPNGLALLALVLGLAGALVLGRRTLLG
jgi:predicted extracellular nuclease